MSGPTQDMTPGAIKRNMAAVGITQREIARKLGVHHITLSKVLHGHTQSHRIRTAIANEIGLTPAQVWPSLYPGGMPRKPGRPPKNETDRN